jgi:hypothetical protein
VISGKRGLRRAETLRARAHALAAELDKPSARATVYAVDAVSHFMLARYSEVIPASHEAERLYREHATSQRDASYFMRLTMVSVRLGSLYATAELKQFASELTSALAEARANEDVSAQLLLALNETLLDELRGRSADAMERLERQRSQLPTTSFGFYHALHVIAVCEAACAGAPLEWGRAVLDREWPRVLRSGMLRVPSLAGLLHNGRMRLLVNQQLSAAQPSPKLERELARSISALARIRTGKASASMQRARLCYAAGDHVGASAVLRGGLAQPSVEVELQRMRYLLAHVVGGEQGRAERQAIEQRLSAQGVEVRAYLASFLPELFRQD